MVVGELLEAVGDLFCVLWRSDGIWMLSEWRDRFRLSLGLVFSFMRGICRFSFFWGLYKTFCRVR